MPLKGQAKTDYQRDYMRKRRSNQPVRPDVLDPVRPLNKEEKLKALRQLIKGNEDTSPLDAVSPSVRREGYGKASSNVPPEVDADGNPIYEVT